MLQTVRLFLLVSLVATTSLWSQAVNGTIVGTIADATGALVANAKVTALETNTNFTRSLQSTESGTYTFSNMPPGLYTISVELAGFRKSVREKVEVTINSTNRVDFQLQPGQISEQIEVTAELPILQTDRTDTGRSMDQRQVSELPLTQNRNFQGLVNLVPGAARAQRNHSEFFNSNDSMQSRVNGQSRLANNIQFEGVDNNHRTGLLTAYIPPAEAIQTVDITTSNYDAEMGRAGGAVMNVTIKSGTNDFHGSLYEFNRVSRLAARRTDLLVKPPITYNYFGGTFGGAIVKNKTFFFGDYLGIRDRLGKGHRVNIPTTAFRAGDLSQSPTTIYDPRTGNPDGTNRLPFAGNIIPTAQISSIAARLNALIPAPTSANVTGVNFEGSTVRAKDTNGFDAKVDHNFNENTRVSVRYSFQRPRLTDPPLYGAPGGPANGGFGGTGITKTHTAGLNATRVLSPTLITEFRVGLMRYRNDAYATDYGTAASDAVGIRGVNISDLTSGLTNIDIQGYSSPAVGYSLSLPWIRFETNWNFINNWTKNQGKHTIKFGADYRFNRDGLLQTQVYSLRGQYRFRSGQTGRNGDPNQGFANAYAAFLLDQPNDYGRDLLSAFPEYVQRPLFTYVQDKWQVSKKLTIDMGVRHELYPPATPRLKGGFSNYDLDTNSLIVAGVGNNPRNLGRKNYLTNFAPRFGISYRLNEKTVIRSGYGLSFIPFANNSYAYNFPVRQNNAFNSANSFVAAGRMADGLPAPLPFNVPADGIIRNAPNQNYDVIPLNYREGYIQSYNLAIQRALPAKFTLDVAFVGNKGTRIPTVFNANPGLVLGAGRAGRPLWSKFNRDTDTNLSFVGTSNRYNSMQVKFDRRFSGGFSMTTAYTWSKAIDISNDNGGFAYYINPERSRAVADFDRRHMFNQSYIWELPFGKGKPFATSGMASQILGGWQITSLLTLMSGQAMNISAPGATLNAPGNNNNPNYIGPGGLPTPGAINFRATGRNQPTWFDPSVFAAPAPNAFGNVGRNAFYGPGFGNVDLSLFRRFQIKERFKLEFRAESFNFSNTPQYPNPDGGFGNATFGQITNAGIGNSADGGSRQIQFGLRLMF
ncbi:MAG: TonB-dependent receptor [Bryobacteraceae bacterium]|nr:TonB-dependent receptor [Bryobacteraceae bacterium]